MVIIFVYVGEHDSHFLQIFRSEIWISSDPLSVHDNLYSIHNVLFDNELLNHN